VETKKNGCVRTKNSGKSCRPAERILQYKGLLPAPLICHTKKIALLQQNAVPIYLSLYDYNNSNFFSGNKRDYCASVSSSGGYRYQDGLHYYLTNENFVRKPIISPQQLHSVDLSAFLASYLIK
jgi:hypothetical protein